LIPPRSTGQKVRLNSTDLGTHGSTRHKTFYKSGNNSNLKRKKKRGRIETKHNKNIGNNRCNRRAVGGERKEDGVGGGKLVGSSSGRL